MNKVIQLYNRIFVTGLALLITIVMAFAIPTSAAETYTVPYRQTWSGGGNSTVTYRITPQSDSDKCTVHFADSNNTTGTLSGTATGNIVYSWTTPGLYIFDLQVTNADQSNYSYDRTVYRIRLYARNTDPYVTVQDLSKAENEDEGKVNDILYRHSYSTPEEPGDGGSTDGGGSNNSNSTPSNNATPTSDSGSDSVTEISDSGSVGLDGIIQDVIESITEWGDVSADPDANGNYIGDHSNGYTGDDSNMILYGFISILAIITLIVWFIKRKHVS